MLVKCETKSNRVKGLSFHPKLNWVLASLHNGVIQLWDYRIGSLIERFEEHEGPVRGVDFHSSQPIFVSGGDDYKIKVWSYRQRRCLFTLLGHLDYIRTVQFHPEYPWAVSASDDQTVRIWNWQSRSCVAVLAGHNHYVMCAQFHPTQDLLVSASLDQTIRVWDISGLREKTVSARSGPVGVALNGMNVGGGQGGSGFSMMHAARGASQSDIFGATDAVCKYILEGHERGVNWAAFHPTMPFIASGADDRLVKLWRYNDTKWWEVETFRGHFNNVSSVLFHPTKEFLLSNSEDRTIRVWDITKRLLVHTFRRENDRFWILAALQKSNVIAVGHDSGMVVFKLDRERPASHSIDENIFFIKDRFLSVHNTATGNCASLIACRRPANAMSSGPRILSINSLNPAELNVLLHYKEGDLQSYDLIVCPDVNSATSNPGSVFTRSGTANGVVFVARNRFAALISPTSIHICNLSNELSKRVEPPVQVDKILFAGNNKLLLKSEELVILYDLSARKSLGEVTCPGGVRYAVWSQDGSYVALVSKHNIVLANRKFEYLCSLHENIRVKGGTWDPLGVFVYSTLSHLKYFLTNGDRGIIRCLAQPIYIMRVAQQKVWFVDRSSGAVQMNEINCIEYLFKLALHEQRFDQVALLIRNGRLCGNAVVGYLRAKGFPEVALQFVDDIKARFNLALEYGNLDVATDAAVHLDQKSCWNRLGDEAMRQGDFQTAEMVYQKVKDFEKLAFFYLISGNLAKLRKMLKVFELRKDCPSRYHTALMLGDSEEKVQILAEVGQIPLAALISKVCGLNEYWQELEGTVKGIDFDDFISNNLPPGTSPSELIPPRPVIELQADGPDGSVLPPTENWPKLSVRDAGFMSAMHLTEKMTPEALELQMKAKMDAVNIAAGGVSAAAEAKRKAAAVLQTGLMLDVLDDEVEGLEGEEGGWGEDDDLDDFGGDNNKSAQQSFAATNGVTPSEAEDFKKVDFVAFGDPPEALWLKGQPMAADLIAAGQFTGALELLQRRIGLKSAAPLQPFFEEIYASSFVSFNVIPFAPSKRIPIYESDIKPLSGKPIQWMPLLHFIEAFREANRLVSTGKLPEALSAHRLILQQLTLATAASLEEENKLLEMLEISRTYVSALRLECERQLLGESDLRRNIELVAYFGCSRLQPVHRFLVLRRAMMAAGKAQNFITAATFAKKLIQGNFGNIKSAVEGIAQAKKMLVVAEKKGTDEHNIDFDASEFDTLTICSVSLTRLPPNETSTKCPYCSAVAKAAYIGQLCSVCELSELGLRVLGLQLRPMV